MTRIPRKLKKGLRTLHGNPRTKWQRKGRLYLQKEMEAFSKAIREATIGYDAMIRYSERFNPMMMCRPIGILMTPPDPPKVGVAVRPMGEIVLSRQQLERLAHHLIITPSDHIYATASPSAEHLSDVVQRLSRKNKDSC